MTQRNRHRSNQNQGAQNRNIGGFSEGRNSGGNRGEWQGGPLRRDWGSHEDDQLSYSTSESYYPSEGNHRGFEYDNERYGYEGGDRHRNESGDRYRDDQRWQTQEYGPTGPGFGSYERNQGFDPNTRGHIRDQSSRYGMRYDSQSDRSQGQGYEDFGRSRSTMHQGRFGEDNSISRGRPWEGQERYGRGLQDPRSSNSMSGMGGYGSSIGVGYGSESGWRTGSTDQGSRLAFGERGPKGYKRSDDRIYEEVCDALSEGHIDASNIEVVVKNGEVTLTGTVQDRQAKRHAEECAEEVRGVSDVTNQIKVKKDEQRIGKTGESSTFGSTLSNTSKNGGSTEKRSS